MRGQMMNLTHSITDGYSRLYEGHVRLAAARPFIDRLISVSALVGMYVLCERGLRRLGHLPAASYSQPIIAAQWVRQAASSPLLLFLSAGLTLAFVLGWRVRWSDFARGQSLRIFIGLVVGLSAWTHASSDYNLYFDQSHAVDRVLLVTLAACVLWRPAFVFPFLLLLYSFLWQYDYPLVTRYPWTDMNMLLGALALMCAFIILRAAAGQRNTDLYVYVLLCIIASYYWGSGLGKAELNWIAHPHLNLLIGGAYANGWLSFLPAASVAAVARALAPLALPLMVFTLLVEWGALFILARRWTTLALIASFVCFHLGVFAFTGMLFWKWIALEAALVALFFLRRATTPAIYSPGFFLLSLPLIAISALWVRPTNLSWYDTRVSYIFGYRGVGESGRVYELPIQTFTPYADMFTLGSFEYINPKPQLLHIWNVTVDREIAGRLAGPIDADEVLAYEAEKQVIHYNEAEATLFDRFMQQYVAHLNARAAKSWPLSLLQPPAHLWTMPRAPVFDGRERLKTVIVYQRTWLLSDNDMRVIREQPIREIAIPAS
jgi:hypothetical protein